MQFIDKNGILPQKHLKNHVNLLEDNNFISAFFMVIPKSLSGIKYNNGWTRCDERMPDTDGDGNYLIIFLSKYGDESTFYLDDVNNNSVWYKQHYTHWRPKTEYPLPIY